MRTYKIYNKLIDKYCFLRYTCFKAPILGVIFLLGVEKMAAINRTRVTFECTECKHRNYDSMKNKKNDPERLQLKKYCPFCKKHTDHKESK